MSTQKDKIREIREKEEMDNVHYQGVRPSSGVKITPELKAQADEHLKVMKKQIEQYKKKPRAK